MSTKAKRPAYLLRVGMAHKRLSICVRWRILTAMLALPAAPITRMLIGWDVGVLIYLVAAAVVMSRCASVASDEAQRGGAGRRRLRHPDPHRRCGHGQPWSRSSPSSRRSNAPIRTTASMSRLRSAPSCCPGPSSTPSSRCTTPTSYYGRRRRTERLAFPRRRRAGLLGFHLFLLRRRHDVPGLRCRGHPAS